MKNHDYEYNYHELANNADFFDDEDIWDEEDLYDDQDNNLLEDIEEL